VQVVVVELVEGGMCSNWVCIVVHSLQSMLDHMEKVFLVEGGAALGEGEASLVGVGALNHNTVGCNFEGHTLDYSLAHMALGEVVAALLA